MELRHGEAGVTFGDALRLWREAPAFVEAFVAALAEAPFDAFLWETPPVSARTLARPFEWVVVESTALARVAADDAAFAEHVRGRRGIRVFENLGGDARLVVPCSEGEADAYPHLAAFLRRGPASQVRRLWPAVARATQERLHASPAPCWVSTSGLGVPWVHVRLDERPKYYSYAPYRDPEDA
jgi:hypothetical protein